MTIPFDLIKKYDKPGPRYTSYPPATFFHHRFSPDNYRMHLVESNQHGDKNMSFYFHVPFCPQMCHFCGCNTDMMPQGDIVARYFEALLNEFETVTGYLDTSRVVTQVHWGGGTPNSVPLKYIARTMDAISSKFSIAPGAEIAMECNPAYLVHNSVDKLSEMGFNRLSLGIQDFDEEVLRIINRKPSKLPVEELVAYIRSKNIDVNLDFVYGLPGQTKESFANAIDRAIKLRPQRLVTFSYAHVPWVKVAQKILEQYTIPSAETKLGIFAGAFEMLTGSGYQAIGLDHFAIEQDGLAKSLKSRTLQRNFMGYCTKEHTGQVYAFGATGISQLGGAYIQNVKSTGGYIKTSLEQGLAVEKGYELTFRDKVCKTVISEIMCNSFVDFEAVAQKFYIQTDQLYALCGFCTSELEPYVQDKIAGLNGHILTVPEKGRFFLRNIAMLFDPLLTGTETNYSKTV